VQHPRFADSVAFKDADALQREGHNMLNPQ
jgi:hypothetical protein